MTAYDRFVDVGIQLHVREWPGHKRAFVLLHGLASNCQTWEAVARQLAAADHQVITVDQRGHGLSEKPESGYDFATITADLAELLAVMALDRPILVGQSWGGNVLLEFGARFPKLACGLGFVDGGFLDLRSRPEATWDSVARDLKPPPLSGTPAEQIRARLRAAHPDWSETGIEATLANFHILADGTVQPQLTLERHMAILRAMWDQQPANLYHRVGAPTLICVAEDGKNPDWTALKSKQVAAAHLSLPQAAVHWFEQTDHDIHVHRPEKLAAVLLDTLANGIWRACLA